MKIMIKAAKPRPRIVNVFDLHKDVWNEAIEAAARRVAVFADACLATTVRELKR